MFYRVCFAAIYTFKGFIKSRRGFSNAGAGAGYTFYPTRYVYIWYSYSPTSSRGLQNALLAQPSSYIHIMLNIVPIHSPSPNLVLLCLCYVTQPSSDNCSCGYKFIFLYEATLTYCIVPQATLRKHESRETGNSCIN